MSGTLGVGSFLNGVAGGIGLGMKFQDRQQAKSDGTQQQTMPQAQQAAQQSPAPQAQPTQAQQPQQQQAGVGLPSNYVQQPQQPAAASQPAKLGNWSFLDSLLNGGKQ